MWFLFSILNPNETCCPEKSSETSVCATKQIKLSAKQKWRLNLGKQNMFFIHH